VGKPPACEWIHQPGENIVDSQIPEFQRITDAVTEINFAIKIIVEEKGDDKIERKPKRIGDSISAFPEAPISDIPKRRKDNNVEHNHGCGGILLIIVRQLQYAICKQDSSLWKA
jgi:hypothetical protein